MLFAQMKILGFPCPTDSSKMSPGGVPVCPFPALCLGVRSLDQELQLRSRGVRGFVLRPALVWTICVQPLGRTQSGTGSHRNHRVLWKDRYEALEELNYIDHGQRDELVAPLLTIKGRHPAPAKAK
jgi:hypothetical protein